MKFPWFCARVVIGLLLTALPLFSSLLDSGDVWNVLDTQAKGLPKERMTWNAAQAFPYTPLTQEEESRGFRLTAIDMNCNWRKAFVWRQPRLEPCMELITARGEYTTGCLGIFFSRDLPRATLSASELSANDGSRIAASNVHFLQIAPYGSTPRFQYAQLLWNPELEDIKVGDMMGIVTMVQVPKDARGGLYHGTLTVTADGQTATLNLALRVADFTLPDAGVFGFYLCGNLYREGSAWNCNQKDFAKGESLNRYFRFYRTRRFNSVSLYDNRPDLRFVNGKVTGYFEDAAAIAQAMKAAGLPNALITYDMRDVGYWCNAVAIRLKELGGQAPQGDIGITMANEKPDDKNPYSEKAKELYAEALRLLLKQAETEQWPRLLVFADEELGNQFPLKVNNYESFMPVIMGVCPEKALVIDNGIGWGRTTATEYALRDGVRHRQYNSWTDESLALAARDGAEVYSFNYSGTRFTNGFVQIRLGSLGHHQWADLWDADNYQWQYSRLSEAGVVTSLTMEKMHEGGVDYAACLYLKQLAEEAAVKGDAKSAAMAAAALRDVSGDLSVNHTTAQNESFLFSDANLNARRWHVFNAIDALLKTRGEAAPAAAAAGQPSIHLQPASRPALPNNDYVLKLQNQREGTITQEAAATEPFWGDLIGPLTHLTEYEAQLRAFCSSEDEFRSKNAPSYSVARLASLPEGLAISTAANHAMPQSPYRYERKDDDGDMWQDDSWEFFFNLPEGKACHLMYNSAGAKVFLNTGVVIPAKDIQSYVKWPFNASGGTVNKLLIPWKYFGLNRQPMGGTVWEFNVGREMHTNRTEKEAPMSWARLATSFHESDKWGRLVFTDDGAAVVDVPPSLLVQPNIARLFTSGQSIRFDMEARPGSATALAFRAVLRHPATGREIALPAQPLPVGAVEMILFTEGLECGDWMMECTIDGQKSLESNIMRFTILPTPWR